VQAPPRTTCGPAPAFVAGGVRRREPRDRVRDELKSGSLPNHALQRTRHFTRESRHPGLTLEEVRMARIKGPKKVHRYSAEFKLKTVKLSEPPDAISSGDGAVRHCDCVASSGSSF
jgi:hypothetical protein